MTQPGWYCERCELEILTLSDNADPTETQACPHCHKRTVIWYLPPLPQEQAAVPAAIQAEQAGPPPRPPINAAAAFAQMRAVVAAAKDYDLPASPTPSPDL